MNKTDKTNWQTKKLGEVCIVQKKKNDRRVLLYVGMEDIESNTGKFIGSILPKRVKSETFYFDSHCLLYGRLRPYLNKVLLPNFEGHCSTEIFPIRVGKNLDKKYLFFWLTFEETVQKINATCTGARMPRANMKEILEFQIPLPSLPEQHRIVGILDEVFEGVGKAKEIAEKNVKNARGVFEAYLGEVFEGEKVKGKSGEWEKKNVGDICEIEYGYTERARTKGKYRFVRITDTDKNGLLKKGKKMFVDSFDSADKYLLTDGDLLMARTGASAGNTLLFQGDELAVFASYLIRMRFGKEVLSELYWHFSKSRKYWDQVRKLSAGSAQPQFNGGALKKIIFSYPKSLSEQKAIVAKLDALSAETKKLEAIYRQKLANLEELKKSVLKNAFSGKY